MTARQYTADDVSADQLAQARGCDPSDGDCYSDCLAVAESDLEQDRAKAVHPALLEWINTQTWV